MIVKNIGLSKIQSKIVKNGTVNIQKHELKKNQPLNAITIIK
jgi:hypothetical protein